MPKAKETAKINETLKEKKKPKNVDRLDSVIENWKLARDYAKDGYFDTWEDCWKLYNNERVDRGYDGVADNFIPETFTIIESILANIVGGKPRFEFYPERPDQEDDTDALNSLMDFFWTQNKMGIKVLPWVKDAIILGTGIMFVFWDDKKGCPDVKYVPLQDFFIDPVATSYDDARYAGFRYLTTKEDLKNEKIIDEKTGEMVPRFKNLDKLKDDERPDKEDGKLDKEKKDQLLGSTIGAAAKEKQVECIYYVDKQRIITVANRSVIIEDEETPFKRDASVIESVDDEGNPVPIEIPEIEPFLNFAPLRNYIDGSLFYAKGDVQIIMDEQERLNDVSNQKSDNLSYVLNRMFTLDPAYADRAEEIESVPGAVFTIPPGALEQIPTQPIGADADNEMFAVKDEMRRATAADELIQGAGQDKGRLTATEVRAQINQAGTRFSVKLSVLESEGYEILASLFFKMAQINITTEMAVRKIGPKGVEWKNYNPGEYLGNYDPKVMLDTTARAVKEEEKQNAMQFFQMASQFPFVDQMELFKNTASKIFDIDDQEIEALLVSEEEMMLRQLMMSQEAQGGGGVQSEGQQV